MPALEDVAATLYALSPEEFTAARDEAARQAEGDLRKAVKGLRRPTVSAWLVNRLARERAPVLEQLLELGPALAAAQASRSGDELRELGRQRRELVSAVTGSAVENAGRDVSAAVRSEVEQTLEAALADPAAADAVRSGSLVRALSFAGFGGVDVEGAVAVSRAPDTAARSAPPRPAGKAEAASTKGKAAVEKAERAAQDAASALDDAVQACRAAEQRHEHAARAVAQAEAARTRAEEQVADLERQLAEARTALAEAGHVAHDAQKQEQAAAQAAERAVRRVQEAQDAAEQARQALDRLRRS